MSEAYENFHHRSDKIDFGGGAHWKHQPCQNISEENTHSKSSSVSPPGQILLIRAQSDHCLTLSITNSLTHWLMLTMLTWFTLLTWFTMLTWFTLLTWFILLRKVRTLSEWADALEEICWMDGLVDWTRLDTPQTVMTTRAPAMLMNDLGMQLLCYYLHSLNSSIKTSMVSLFQIG